MLLNLSDLSSEPLYSQIMRQMRLQILAGMLKTGMLLPSIRDFARDYRVSVITVQKAYDELAREGLIVARRGKGFFVADIPRSEKTAIIVERCRHALHPILREALNGGLDVKQLRVLFDKIVREISNGAS